MTREMWETQVERTLPLPSNRWVSREQQRTTQETFKGKDLTGKWAHCWQQETERVSVHADKFQQRLCHTLTARGVGTTDRQLHWGDSGGSEDKPSSSPYLKEEATSLSLMVVSERRQMATRCSWWSRRAEWSQQRQKVFSKGVRPELPEIEGFLLLLLFVFLFVFCFYSKCQPAFQLS